MEKRMQCDTCRGRAILFQQYSGKHLCKRHFVEDIEAKAKRVIRTHRWLRSDDHIAIALSGNKQSSALLYFLKKLTEKRRDIRITAITVDEGITGRHGLKDALQIADSLGVDCICGSFQEAFGITTDEIADKKGEGQVCRYCCVLRRQLLATIARRAGVTKLALGLTLDDRAQSVLANILRGETNRLVHPIYEIKGTIPWISPFISVPRYETVRYADLHNVGINQVPCQYDHDTFRGEITTMLDDYTGRHPATKYALMNLGETIERTGINSATGFYCCDRCLEPCEGACDTCRIVDEVTPIAP
jgi:uncharacterized protein (TIGR00269 family)